MGQFIIQLSASKSINSQVACESRFNAAICWTLLELKTVITLVDVNKTIVNQTVKLDKGLPSFFGTQSTPNVNFLICTMRYSGKEENREVLQKKSIQLKKKLKLKKTTFI